MAADSVGLAVDWAHGMGVRIVIWAHESAERGYGLCLNVGERECAGVAWSAGIRSKG